MMFSEKKKYKVTFFTDFAVSFSTRKKKSLKKRRRPFSEEDFQFYSWKIKNRILKFQNRNFARKSWNGFFYIFWLPDQSQGAEYFNIKYWQSFDAVRGLEGLWVEICHTAYGFWRLLVLLCLERWFWLEKQV